MTTEQVEHLKIVLQVQVLYLNWRGEEAKRTITPLYVWEGSTEYHPEPQPLLHVYDHDRQAERDYAIKDIAYWQKLNTKTVLESGLVFPVESLVEWVIAMNEEVNKDNALSTNISGEVPR